MGTDGHAVLRSLFCRRFYNTGCFDIRAGILRQCLMSLMTDEYAVYLCRAMPTPYLVPYMADVLHHQITFHTRHRLDNNPKKSSLTAREASRRSSALRPLHGSTPVRMRNRDRRRRVAST